MSATESTEAPRGNISQQAIAKQFVRLYYGILNTHHEFLYQFYGKSSTVTVSETLEDGETAIESAEEETTVKELLTTLYADVSIRVTSAVPQFSIDDSVLIHVNGIMERKSTEGRRAFTQVFILFPQENGYYIRTDVAHVMGPNSTCLHADCHFPSTNTVWAQGDDVRSFNCQGASALGASSSERQIVLRLGSYDGDIPDAENSKRNEIRTATPPLDDAPRNQAKSQASDQESDDHVLQSTRQKSKPWIVRPPSSNSAVCHSVMPQAITMHALQPTMTMPPPVAVGHASMNGMMYHPHPHPHPSMAMYPAAAAAVALASAAAQTSGTRYLRQRSASMGCDPWAAQRALGHGVFIARLPFAIQPADVEQAFASFGPIKGGKEGIQVRDGRNGCYAFVTFENPESAQSAIQQGAVIQGKRVFVEPRYPREDHEATTATFLPYPAIIPTPTTGPPLAAASIPYHLSQNSSHVPTRMLR